MKRFLLLAFLLIVFSAAVCALADEYMVFLGEDTPVGGANEYNAGNKKFDRELTVPVINGTQAFFVSSSSSALTYIYPVNGAVRTLTLDLPCKNEWVTVELNGEMLIPGVYAFPTVVRSFCVWLPPRDAV